MKIREEKFPEASIGELFSVYGGEKVLYDFIDAMASAAATEINILDPDHILIGGGVFNMAGFPLDLFTERILARTRKPLPAEDLRLIFTEDEPDKAVIGGAIYARRKLSGK